MINKEISAKVISLIDDVCLHMGEFSADNKRDIREIAEYCRTKELYKYNVDYVPEEFFHYTPEQLYLHMLHKMADAPTWFHCTGAVVLMMPLIDDALERRDANE